MDPDGQVRACLARLEELDRKCSRFQDMAAEELVTFEELGAKVVELETAREDAQRKLRELQGRGLKSWRKTGRVCLPGSPK